MEALMDYWADFVAWRGRRKGLLREAQEAALAREERRVREACAAVDEGPRGIGVRWGLAEDEARVAEILELNGMPRWVAFEERFVVAEERGEVMAAVRYRTEPKRLFLGLLVAEPWAGERRLAVALYAGAWELARELGAREVRAEGSRRDGYPREAGYRRRGGVWRLDATRAPESGGVSPDGGSRWLGALMCHLAVPLRRAFRG